MAKRKQQITSLSDALRVSGPAPGSGVKYIQYSFAGVKNLYLAVYDTGARVFQFKKTRFGVSYSLTIGALGEITMDEGIAKARECSELVKNGINPRNHYAMNRMMTLQRFVDEHFWPYAQENYKSHLNVRNMLDKRILPAFGSMTFAAIDRRIVRSFHKSICDEINVKTGRKVGGTTANRTLALVSSIFKYAMEFDFVEMNPCVGVRKAKENKSRDRYLLQDEYPRFMQATMSMIDRPQAQAILILAVLGLRPCEVFSLAWRDVHLADNQLYIRDPKNGESRFVSLNSIASDLFRKRHEEKDAKAVWVFPSNSSSGHLQDVRKTFAAICRKAEITGLNLYDLRRSHGTLLLQSGVDLLTIKEILGHKSLKSTLVYARVSSVAMVAANELAATKINDAINFCEPPGSTA